MWLGSIGFFLGQDSEHKTDFVTTIWPSVISQLAPRWLSSECQLCDTFRHWHGGKLQQYPETQHEIASYSGDSISS